MVSLCLKGGECFYGETHNGRAVRSDLYRYIGSWQELYDYENRCWVEMTFVMKHVGYEQEISLQGVA